MSLRTLAFGLLALAASAATALPATAAAKTPKGFFGVVPQESLTRGDYQRLAQGKVRTVRIGFNWAAFQQVDGQCRPTPQVGICSWTTMDGIVGNLAQAGIRVVPTVFGSPSFVSKNPTRPPLDRRDLKRWKAFVESAAARYGRGGAFWKTHDNYGGKPVPIKKWQIWNEPNSKQFWSPAPNAKKYAKLVKASSKALRKGDRKADVILGGMFPDAKAPIGPYMKDFYRSGKIERHFDELGVHPYAKDIGDLKRQLRAARKAARGKTGIFISELGWSSAKSGHFLNKGKRGQAKMLKKGFKLVSRKRRSWKITGVNWFALRDTKNKDTCRFCLKSGLLNVNGKPKPSWREFKKFSK